MFQRDGSEKFVVHVVVSRITNTRYEMHRIDEPPANARTRMGRRTSWRQTWSPNSQTPPFDDSFRTSTSHKQSPQATNVRHSLDFASLRDACLSKLSKSRKRMSYNSYIQDREMSSPMSEQASPRLFPLAPMVEYQTSRRSTEFNPETKVEVDDSEGSQAIRADIEPIIHTLYESTTGRFQYVIADPITKEAIIIDPVLDRNPYATGITTTAADQILYLIREHRYHVVRILETHSNQEHPTSAWYLRTQLRDSNGNMPRICTGKAIAGVQRMFARQYQVQDPGWSSRFDFFRDGQIFVVGEMKVQCVQLLSQPDWFAFIIGHNIFVGKEVSWKETSGKGTTAKQAQQIIMRRLAQFVNRYAFHPQSSENNISRPSTAQSEVSQWMHDAVLPRHESIAAPHESMATRRESGPPQSPRSPRGSTGMARMRRIMGRQSTNEDWSSVSSRTSSRQSNRRISQLTELA